MTQTLLRLHAPTRAYTLMAHRWLHRGLRCCIEIDGCQSARARGTGQKGASYTTKLHLPTQADSMMAARPSLPRPNRLVLRYVIPLLLRASNKPTRTSKPCKSSLSSFLLLMTFCNLSTPLCGSLPDLCCATGCAQACRKLMMILAKA